MAPQTTKRRKLSNDPDTSGTNDRSSKFEVHSDSEGNPSEDGQEASDSSQPDKGLIKANKSKANGVLGAPLVVKKTAFKPIARQDEGFHSVGWAGETFKSNLFKLQVDELLEQVKPKQKRQSSSIEKSLLTLKTTIENIPPRKAASIVDAERSLRKGRDVIVPFPYPRPPKDTNYTLQYEKPAHINTVGSYALNTATKHGDDQKIDLVVTMPPGIFQEKDYLNHRYFYKRAYYLACLAHGIMVSRREEFALRFEYLHGNRLLPVLVAEARPDSKSSGRNVRVVILPAVSEGTFPKEKTLPNKNCVRPKSSTDDGALQDLKSTPFYNASLRADGLITAYLKVQHEASRQCEAYKDACILGRIWLRQRGLHASIQGGGFGNFEWAVTIALLLQGGGSQRKPAFSPGYSSYQLFKATLQYLGKDLVKHPQVVGDESPTFAKKDGFPVLFDADRGLNILYKMTPWSYQLLQHEARSTIAMLNDSAFDQFDATFIMKADQRLCRYDINIELPASSLVPDSGEEDFETRLSARCQELYSFLVRGLMDRARLISLHCHADKSWKPDSSPAAFDQSMLVQIGITVDPANVHRLVDHGPAAEDKKAAAAFRAFWAEKAELRRFKDGRILESLVWSNKGADQSIFQQVVSHIISRHFGAACAQSITYVGEQDSRILAPALKNRAPSAALFQPIMTAFQTLEQDLRGLEELPLQLRHVFGADSQLSYGSVEIPFTPDRTRMSTPADVIIQFEGSARWPDDLNAIQRTKIAFLLKLAELLNEAVVDLTARVGLENEDAPLLNQAFLDIIYPSGAAFRLRIHHDREATLLERKMKTKGLPSQEKTGLAFALARHNRDFIRQPAHTQAMQTLCTRYSALSGTIRMLKKWIFSHLLSPYFSSSLIDLLAARTFTNPYPWVTPSSPTTGFLRTLITLSRWDWRSEPWIVDLGAGDMKAEDVSAMTTRFDAWRKIDPAMNRVTIFAASNIDADGTTWSDHARPPKVVAAHLTALAQAAVALMKNEGIHLDIGSLFIPHLEEYDVVIHLNAKFASIGRSFKVKTSAFKNLQQARNHRGDDVAVGYNPIQLFLSELEDIYGQALLFFYDACEGNVIAGLWNPQTENRPWKLKLGYSSTPVQREGSDEILSIVNKKAILNEIARLGGDMVLKIEEKAR